MIKFTLLANLFVLSLLTATTAANAQRQIEPTADLPDSQLEQQMFDIINKERLQYNAPPVVLNEKLSNLARNYAQRLIKENFFAHVDPQGRNPEQRATAAGINQGVYENLAMQSRGYGQGDVQLLINANNLMMNEPPDKPNHRYNILVPKHVCVGVGVARSNNKLMVVEEFTDTSVF